MVDVKVYYMEIEKHKKELEEKIRNRDYKEEDITSAKNKIENCLCSILYEYVMQEINKYLNEKTT